MINEKELVRWFKLCKVDGLGPKKILRLFSLYKDIDTVWSASSDELLRTGIFKENMIESWQQLKNASDENFEKIISECKQHHIAIVPIISDQYPLKLKLISNPPVNLFLQGDQNLIYSKKIAIVGSRQSNDDAKKWAFEKAAQFAQQGIVVVSGGAIGIDVEAHKGTLSVDGKTIGVMGTGLLNLYPEEHKPLFDEIRKKGLLVSENLPYFTGGRIALLQRNRITSGISDALIAVTSLDNGGVMTQLKHAHEQQIPIFCPSNPNLTPREGIEKVKKEYKMTEVDDITSIVEMITKNNPQYLVSQQKTLFL